MAAGGSANTKPIKRKKRRKKKKKLSAEELRQRKLRLGHLRSGRSIFRNLGFDRVSEVVGVEIEFGGQHGEFDDAWIYENVIILFEYTTSQSSNVTAHIKHKKIIFDEISANTKDFLVYLRNKVSAFDDRLSDRFHADQYILRIVYCSLNSYDESVRKVVSTPVYLDYPILKYFEKLAGSIKMSALDEAFELLGVEPQHVAKNGIFPAASPSNRYEGSLLPESSSGFPPGYKVVSFYADAASLLGRVFVLRRDGWRGSEQAYQRMIQPTKIEAIRKKLKSDKRVFVNNLVATLPPDVQPVMPGGKTADITKLTNTQPVTIQLPLRPNSIGVIDGQHRLYSYYETRDDDKKIAKLRHQQNLLVTGIIYPGGIKRTESERFEAELFLSINANQTNAPTALRQEIEVLLRPFSSTAIGRQVMRRLAQNGPLAGYVENYFFDKGKLKTSSIVSFGLRALIKFSGDDTLFKLFSHGEKGEIVQNRSTAILDEYIVFCVEKINTFLGAIKSNVEIERWTPDPAVKNRLLSVTYINSFLITMRLLILNHRSLDYSKLNKSFQGINEFGFKKYHSSQYGRMAEEIYNRHFKTK